MHPEIEIGLLDKERGMLNVNILDQTLLVYSEYSYTFAELEASQSCLLPVEPRTIGNQRRMLKKEKPSIVHSSIYMCFWSFETALFCPFSVNELKVGSDERASCGG
jgi:hypothetical protein